MIFFCGVWKREGVKTNFYFFPQAPLIARENGRPLPNYLNIKVQLLSFCHSLMCFSRSRMNHFYYLWCYYRRVNTRNQLFTRVTVFTTTTCFFTIQNCTLVSEERTLPKTWRRYLVQPSLNYIIFEFWCVKPPD